MKSPNIDMLLKKVSNKFLLSNALAQRAKEISEGSLPYIEEFNPLDPIDTSMREFVDNKFSVKVLKGPVEKPVKEIEQKAKDFWSIDTLEKKELKKSKKVSKKKK